MVEYERSGLLCYVNTDFGGIYTMFSRISRATEGVTVQILQALRGSKSVREFR